MTEDVKVLDAEAKAEADYKTKEADYVAREADGKLTPEERLSELEDKITYLWAGHPKYDGPAARRAKYDADRKKAAAKLAAEKAAAAPKPPAPRTGTGQPIAPNPVPPAVPASAT